MRIEYAFMSSDYLRMASRERCDLPESAPKAVIYGVEPVILPMRLFQRNDPPDPEPGTPGNEKEARNKGLWAGYFAMRRPSRVAA